MPYTARPSGAFEPVVHRDDALLFAETFLVDTQGIFHAMMQNQRRGKARTPSFSDLRASTRLPDTPSALYIPWYPHGTHQRFLRGQEAIVKGYRLANEAQKVRVVGDIDAVFDTYARGLAGQPAIVVVDQGVHDMRDYLSRHSQRIVDRIYRHPQG